MTTGEGASPQDNQRMEQTAARLRVPQTLRGNPTIKEYLRIHNNIGDIREMTSRALATVSQTEPVGEFTPPFFQRSPREKPIFFPKGQIKSLSSGVESVIKSGYEHFLPVVDVAEAVVEEGLCGQKVSADFLIDKLNTMLDAYGLSLSSGTSRDQRIGTHIREYKEMRRSEQQQAEESDPSLKYFLLTRDQQTNLYLPYREWLYAPRMHAFAAILNKLNALGISNIPIPKNENDNNNSHYYRKDRLLDLRKLGVIILMDGINGKTALPNEIISPLNYALEPYSVSVKSKPLEQRRDRAVSWSLDQETKQIIHGVGGRSLEEWNEIAQEYELDSKLSVLGIAKDHWRNSDVRDFGKTIKLAETIAHLYDFDLGQAVIQDVTQGTSFHNRRMRSELIMRGVRQILEEGFQGGVNDPDYLRKKISLAISGYGLEVIDLSSEANKVQQTHKPEGVWQHVDSTTTNDPFIEYGQRYGAEYLQLWTQASADTNKRNKQIDKLAAQWGISGEVIADAPSWKYLGLVVDAMTLQDIFIQRESDIPGLTPSLASRYSSGKHLINVVIAMLEEGFASAPALHPRYIQENITLALAPYGLGISANS